ncbi:MAG: arabinan endo-1,5-alpha-L-arabinosidase [Flammeovirgaceae bacterium]|nr:arabinan endo-1,5-alpha-L-arabinosidase [Flammeovirgaceae bacterium]MBE61642.1 arabinan endo-1,5-alpha-L-arabinosidase [Flammeovirgaceae bacterium]MBR07466.1 arabinan endo-1,5-alpha-L-arabinosidase [Rickettsiales bacterium]HCX20293.1 arabinan endo-1,5-alpha-L-arabinosidase [Cytophagales bacterium]|tara:strand:+ start:190 stop:1185 length:996 start_codon:yes stop_codon:yes gene_type:complete
MKNLMLILMMFLLGTSYAQETDIGVHDPVMIKEGDTYYLFCTGWGISVWSSKDMKSWKKEESIFGRKPPEWTQEVVPGFAGHMWAPDVSYYDGQYYLYYSVSAFAKNTSAIGLVTNKTLDPSSPDFGWVDQGKVVQSVPFRDFWNAIDPNLIVDEDGYPWLNFGSFWGGIKMVKLVPDRDKIAEPEEWLTLAKRNRSDTLLDNNPGDGAIEAPFIFKKDSMYYLFVSWDYCCRGENSTYKVVVGRSSDVKGPYLDKEGNRMDLGGGSLVIEGDKNWAGIGHNSAYTFDGKDYLVVHAYDVTDGGHSKLKILNMNWDENGWPLVDKTEINPR